jgi:hypothetical protein
METFPSSNVRAKRSGEYRAKRVILEVYDALRVAIEMGVPYDSVGRLAVRASG